MIVIGAGVAGTAAALSAARAALAVTLVDGGVGASTLSTGALDGAPADGALRSALDLLGGYRAPDGGATLLTTAGVVRRAEGHDASLLDVGPIRTGAIAVVRCRRPGWDADALVAAWGERFVALDARVARYVGEDVLPDADFASRHDDGTRIGWLAERLREALTSTGQTFAAVALPPALGVETSRAPELSRRVGLPCGEAIGLPGGPAGLRFEHARDRALAATPEIRRVRARVRAVRATPSGWRVEADGAEGHGHAFDSPHVVVAAGGLIGGGVEFFPGEATLATALPPRSQAPFRIPFEVPAPLAAHARALESPASLFGAAPEALASGPGSTLQCVGVMTSSVGEIPGAPGLFAAGDIVADAPRAWLTAFAAGWRIGARLHAAQTVRASASPITGEPPRSIPPTRP